MNFYSLITLKSWSRPTRNKSSQKIEANSCLSDKASRLFSLSLKVQAQIWEFTWDGGAPNQIWTRPYTKAQMTFLLVWTNLVSAESTVSLWVSARRRGSAPKAVFKAMEDLRSCSRHHRIHSCWKSQHATRRERNQVSSEELGLRAQTARVWPGPPLALGEGGTCPPLRSMHVCRISCTKMTNAMYSDTPQPSEEDRAKARAL